ncbi:helix-turn-helix domain-containing protein [Parvularcula dongshanensis]|uniref:AraC-like DNA-binding protein n=1 Tax=Parvularcula dongshanensis TaxID=1173995 RepID=A0A840I411_9PROT|nr:AraC family transcriptional regulator [Parvularcula dongshanensis]MBB4659609.1 AraC-like DNA-binding protein [Parvularcula dongshanensis]
MEIVANAYNMLHGGAFNRIVRHGGEVAFVTDERGFPFAVEKPAEVRVVMEATLLFAHALLRLIAPGVAGPSLHCVRLRRPKGPAAVPFERLAEVRYGAKAYALVYDRAAAEGERVRFPPPGALTFEAVGEEQARLLQEAPAPVTDAVREALAAEDVSQEEVALALDMSPATLRRHLQAEGTSFRALRAAALTARATAFLRSDLPLPSIAARLGFSDVRSFNRAFKAWTGATPATARRRLR